MPTRLWGAEQLAGTSLAGQQTGSQVTALPNGGFAVAWQDNGPAVAQTRAQIYDAFGRPQGQEIVISSVGNAFINPSLTTLADGTFMICVTQRTGPDNYILAAVYDQSGNPVRSFPVVFAFGLDDQSDVAAYGTGSIVAWADPDTAGGSDILFRTFDAAGVGTSGLITANTTTAGAQYNVSVATSPEGGRVAFAYYSDAVDFNSDAVLVKVFRSEGLTNATEIRVDPGQVNFEAPLTFSSIVWLTPFDFLVTWDSFFINFALGETHVLGRIYRVGSSGSGPISDVFTVSTTPGRDIGKPDVTALPNGGFVVTWVSDGFTGQDDDLSIRLQVFDARGGKVGSEHIINTTTSGLQDLPSVTTLADGRLAVSWTDASSDGGDIRFQIVDPRDGIVTGTSAADTLCGHHTVGDEISGFNGSDTIFGLGGNDQVHGGDGADSVTLGQGDDAAYGGAGSDTLSGGNGDDALHGEANGDTLNGGKGDDELFGGSGNDTLTGGAGADVLDGGADTDTADYSASTTAVIAALNGGFTNAGDALGDSFVSMENITGSAFNDTLRGTNGANVIIGGNGNDRLEALGGLDTLTGGLGNDTFFINNPNDGADTITDFGSTPVTNDDRFELRGSNFNGQPAGALLANQFQSSTSNVAQSATVRFFFETDTGNLFWDRDGNAGAFNPVLIATLQIGATVTVGDFTVI